MIKKTVTEDIPSRVIAISEEMPFENAEEVKYKTPAEKIPAGTRV